MNTTMTPKTFTAHGHIWQAHTPGDAMPCDGGDQVHILLRGDKQETLIPNPAKCHWWGSDPKEDYLEIIGWRYASDTPPQEVDEVAKLQTITAGITWHKGPGLGGGGSAGTHKDGYALWYDGDRLLMAFPSPLDEDEVCIRAIRIVADGGVSFMDDDTDEQMWDIDPDNILWWAKMNDALPPASLTPTPSPK